MESWCFDSLDKGYVPSDSSIRAKNTLMGWEFKPSFSYDNSILVPSQQSLENQGFGELGFVENVRKHPQDPLRNLVNSSSFMGDIINPGVVASNVIAGDEESSSKLSSSIVDSSSRESSLIDLKLGGFGDIPSSNSPRSAPGLSSAESSTPVKRARLSSNLSSQKTYCQVHGCNKDLSSAKDYHKRHKVCDVHSKTAKVIVNGIEQRFCQQCSRFHLMVEFDDGKRSCRKRLAGHNERRRKPQVGFNGVRTGRVHSYTDSGSIQSNFQGATLTTSSFICQDILPRVPSHAEGFETNGWGRHIKVENGVNYMQKSANASSDGLLQQKSFVPSYCEKQYHPIVNGINSIGPGSVFSENTSQYPSEIASRSILQTNSLGNEDLTFFEAASTVQGCALSLLSSQSQNSSGHSSGIPPVDPLITPSSGPHYTVADVSGKLFGIGCSQGLVTVAENRYPSYRNCPTGRSQLSAIPGINNGSSVNCDFVNGILQGSELMNNKDHFARDDGTTINLLQLSSQLQRVENQRQSAPVKGETEGFFCLRMT